LQAETVWPPAPAPPGTEIERENDPLPGIVNESSVAPSQRISALNPGAKPEPLTVTVVPGGMLGLDTEA
jgi:hypothetical protein